MSAQEDSMLSGIVQQWLAFDEDEDSRALVKRLAHEDAATLAKMMHPRISFGTAGLRAAMEPGFGRMNVVTVRQASQGLAKYVAVTVDNALQRGIVVGHDHRHNSERFAHIVLQTFARAGFKTHFLGLVHTPQVPFGVSRLQAACGVMITASHNPAKDNGYKVYWENACQIIPPHDRGIAASIDANLEPWSVVPLTEAQLKPVDLTTAYFDDVLGPLTTYKAATPFKIVYTPMHGVGLPYALRSFERLGFGDEVVVVREQAKPDPDFPTVAFPNPEEHGALDLAINTATEHGASVVLANDPDADRFTCAVQSSGTWKQLTGDQTGMLFADYLLETGQFGNNNSSSSSSSSGGGGASSASRARTYFINSTVSSQVLKAQAEDAGCFYEETLSGFKWLGNKAIDLEAAGHRVPFAYEEAIGYMLGGHAIKDKDGISALHVFVQLLARLFDSKVSVVQRMHRISERVGYFATHNGYYLVEPSQLDAKFEHIRRVLESRDDGARAIRPAKAGRGAFKDLSVTWLRDLTLGYDSQEPGHEPKLPVSSSSQMITFACSSADLNARCTLRGSGTEPKLKVYIESRAQDEATAQATADHVWDILKQEMFYDVGAGAS